MSGLALDSGTRNLFRIPRPHPSEAAPEVFGHNIETVERLYGSVRPGADYRRSLSLLRYVKEANPAQLTKSSIMVGLGVAEEEVLTAIVRLRKMIKERKNKIRRLGWDKRAFAPNLQELQKNIKFEKIG